MQKTSANTRPVTDFLTESYADARSKAVSNVDYKLSVRLGTQSESFSGRVVTGFDYKKSAAPITVDFLHGKVNAAKVNGQSLDVTTTYNGKFLTLPAKHLKVGRNSVEIDFDHPYSKTGDGLYKFTDPEDKEIYLYTNFEPYGANEFFPCFDQPDLKATYEMDVTAPTHWVVISSNREESVSENGANKVWKFPRTARFSTYIFSMHAGPYQKWEEQNEFKYPLRLFARKSMAKWLPADDWFRWTRAGFDFFDEYFGVPYPFEKYDQILCPDANMGAMENVGAVTFAENLIRRGPMTVPDKEKLTNVILHEMAHMWFGNLVTMKWWDELWLNESFATYMATLATYEATEFKIAWHTFYLVDKIWGYTEDQWPTTHPIQAIVPDTAQAFTNFDGITYGKGASLLKQLSYHITPEAFRDGVKSYFKTYAYKNTVLKDFMSELEAGAKRQGQKVSLTAWTKAWLQKEGLSAVRPTIAYKKDKISKLVIDQSKASGVSVLRPFRANVGLYDLKGDKLVLRKSFPVRFEKKSTAIKEVVGEAKPDLLYLNTEDHAFAKIQFDKESLKKLPSLLSKVEDAHLRIMLWESVWDEVRESRYGVTDFLDLVLQNLSHEDDLLNATRIVARAIGRRKLSPSALYYLPAGKTREEYARKFEELLVTLLRAAPVSSDFQKLWIDTFAAVATSQSGLATLKQWLSDATALKGYDLDQDRRWAVLLRLSELNHSEADQLVTQEREKDKSDAGKKAELAARVIKPSLENKQKWVGELLKVGALKSVAEQRTVMGHLFPVTQVELRKNFAETYYKMLPELARERDPEFMRTFVPEMAPAFCDVDANKKFNAFVSKMTTGPSSKAIPPFVKKPLKIALSENERCIRVRKAQKGV